MLDVHAVKDKDFKALNPAELAEVAAQMLTHIEEQRQQLAERDRHISEQGKRIGSDAQAIRWRDTKIESLTFELTRLKRWKFGAKTERMTAEQREIF